MQLIISEGNTKTTFNGKVLDDQQYKAVYDGNKGRMLLRDKNKAAYIEVDNEDLANILDKRQKGDVESKLKNMLKNDTPQLVSLKTPLKNKTLNIFDAPKKKKKTRRRLRYKRKTPTKRKTKKRRSPSKKTIKEILTPDFMKTII